ncbi:MAG: CBS domain-containing protein [Candidatus Hodarchaeales archaeon]|jgi:CBS domain-containing protein
MNNDQEEVLIGALIKSPIISMPSNLPVTEAAKLMRNYQIGSVIIKDKEIIGILTKGDIIQRVVGRALDPGIVLAGDAMSKPVSFVSSDETLDSTMRQMSKQKIERILVVDAQDSSKALGIVSTNDLLTFAPELLAIRREQNKIMSQPDSELIPPHLQGFCDDCGNYSVNLSSVNGYTLCSQCLEVQAKEDHIDDDDIM